MDFLSRMTLAEMVEKQHEKGRMYAPAAKGLAVAQ
ncbi:hypothetical protein DFAR_1110068 [Desulfarculales bacterium]